MQTRHAQQRDPTGHRDHQILAQEFPQFNIKRWKQLAQFDLIINGFQFTLRNKHDLSKRRLLWQLGFIVFSLSQPTIADL